MKVVFEKVVELDRGIWSAVMRPTDVQRLEGSPVTQGARSVVLVDQADFDPKASTLSAELGALRALVVGTSDQALMIQSDADKGQATNRDPKTAVTIGFDAGMFPGDTEFLRELAQLPEEAESAGRQLLASVRSRNPGSMKRGSRRNFSNHPDNFWYAVIQPRKGNMSITVRGRPELFQPSKLDLKPDRPGYTRFYLAKQSDVAEAFRIVSASRRRK
jgi:hypothetical protein